uniref:Bug family tripartite tricarboxylate transporter substrate binding protein n=1 Tax=Pararhizobium sp. IMCC3301 TaxID=3067904 RepID=UPI0027427EB0|nr:tripartite tricarboxylate transporter substrate binding protein [Pararhizobium sp. IMCC3301]
MQTYGKRGGSGIARAVHGEFNLGSLMEVVCFSRIQCFTFGTVFGRQNIVTGLKYNPDVPKTNYFFKRTRHMPSKNLVTLGFALAATLFSGLAWAEYPEKAINLIVPYGAGGGTDLSARILAPALEKELGQPVIVVNKPGGGGAVALGTLFAGKPDGYTIALGTGSNMTIIPHTTPVGYEIENFTYIANYVGWPFMMVVNSEIPAESISDVISWAKENPGELVSASTGGFNYHVVAMELMSQASGGLDIRNLPTNSTSESLARLLSGDANIVVGSPATYLEHVKSGELRAIGIVSDVRGPLLEGLELESSKDVLGFELKNTTVVIAPPGVPEDIRARLEEAMESALADPEVIAQVNALGFPVQYDAGPVARDKTLETSNMFGGVIKKLTE